MFDIFKKDIKIGDKVKLYLTTGKEPSGLVIEIGENFVLLKSEEGIQNRFFDKLLGGWEILVNENKKELKDVSEKENHLKFTKDPEVDKELLLELAYKFKAYAEKLDISITPNANIIEARGTTCVASNSEFPKILILNNRIVGKELITEIEEFQMGSIIPVIVRYFVNKDQKKVMAIAVAKPTNIIDYTEILIESLNNDDFEQAKNTCYILKDINDINSNNLRDLLKNLKGIHPIDKTERVRKLNIQNIEDADNKKIFKNIERKINDLIRQANYEQALVQITEELERHIIEDKYKSSLLLRKAQIYSSINNPLLSEKAYLELIKFNEKVKAPSNNLSHLYTELARIQMINSDNSINVISSVKKALYFNPDNNFAINLLSQLEGKSTRIETQINEKASHLLIEVEEDPTAISKMIDIDIKEHKYAHAGIIKNGGQPTTFIARSILEEATKLRNIDLSESFPIYLDAAKAFSELNVGSYDLQDYLESVAYYSMLKGNSLYNSFRNSIVIGEKNVQRLTRIKDSACSYYIESLNLLSNIDSNHLVAILGNYLKLNVAVYQIANNPQGNLNNIFVGKFASVFKTCVLSKNLDEESLAYKVIVDCGASSINAWNELANLPNGTGFLYRDLTSNSRRTKIFELINNIETTNININSKPGEFLKSAFLNRRSSTNNFIDNISNLYTIDIEPHSINLLLDEWNRILGFDRFLTPTDKEVKNEVDNILQILRPYLNRTDRERLNILIQIRSAVEKQLRFINDNTTFYGRTFFYGLLSKWKRDIDSLLDEKVTQTYPSLDLIIDPPYYIATSSELSVPLLIRNNGQATAEGYQLEITFSSAFTKKHFRSHSSNDKEIPSGGKVESIIFFSQDLVGNSKSIHVRLDITTLYQKKRLDVKRFDFTLEKEPSSTLIYDDIPWRDGPIPPEQLFKGRKKMIADLAQHYLSIEKDKPYILYGLTRTGKSSILEYLRKDLEGEIFSKKGKKMLVLTFSWDLSEASSFKKAPDFWNYVLYQQTYEALENFGIKYNFSLSGIKINENARAKDFKIILAFMESHNLYPIFFVDEFTFIKTLIDDNTINSAFLHTLRQHSLNELASFIFAGTYDIKSLIRNERYGITGQLVNAIEEQVNEISDEAAEELINVIEEKLSFTKEAVEHIKFLSGRVPYFIQIVCKYCGYFAAENKRRVIGFPEVEKVIKILIGQTASSSKSLVKKLPENVFQNNQFSPTDPKEVYVLISSIVHFNRERILDPRGVGFSELQQLWAEKKINAFRPKLAESINLLKEKKVLIQDEDEELPVYKLGVDLFRRWWAIHNSDLNLILTTLID